MDIFAFFSETAVGNLLLFLIVITPLLAGLYKKFFLSPKLQVSLAPLFEGPVGFAGGNPPTQTLKSQGLLLTAKRATIHNCKAKMVFVDGTSYLTWDSRRDVVSITQPRTLTRDLLEGEEVLLTIWEAHKNSDGEWFSLKTEREMHGKMEEFSKKLLSLELSFLSEEGLLNKKPYRYKVAMDSWAALRMVPIS